MRTGTPFIVNLACTGVIPTRAMSPHVPLSHDEILVDVARAISLGVQMVHLHARDANGVQTADPQAYGRLVESIRALHGGQELVVCVTTSGRLAADFESRSRVLDLDGSARPDMASLTLGSLNFMQSASVNQPDTIRRLAARMLERGIRPELEVFDLGMANFARVLLHEGPLGMIHAMVKALGPYLMPMTIGSIPLGLMAAAICYKLVRMGLTGMHHRRERRRLARQKSHPV